MAAEVFFISMVARELGMHPQTLRKYERLGLVQPSRTAAADSATAPGSADEASLPLQLVVILNWLEGLKQRVPLP